MDCLAAFSYSFTKSHSAKDLFHLLSLAPPHRRLPHPRDNSSSRLIASIFRWDCFSLNLSVSFHWAVSSHLESVIDFASPWVYRWVRGIYSKTSSNSPQAFASPVWELIYFRCSQSVFADLIPHLLESVCTLLLLTIGKPIAFCVLFSQQLRNSRRAKLLCDFDFLQIPFPTLIHLFLSALSILITWILGLHRFLWTYFYPSFDHFRWSQNAA